MAKNRERDDRSGMNLKLLGLVLDTLVQPFNVVGIPDKNGSVSRKLVISFTTPFTLMQPTYPSFVTGLKPDHSPQFAFRDAELFALLEGIP